MKRRYGWYLISLIVGMCTMSALIVFGVCWWCASPWAEPDSKDFYAGFTQQGEPTDEELHIIVELPYEGKPKVSYRPPRGGTIGVPRFSLRQTETKKDTPWELVLEHPVTKDQCAEEVKTIPDGWSKLVGSSWKSHGQICSVPLLAGGIDLKTESNCPDNVFNERRNHIENSMKTLDNWFRDNQKARDHVIAVLTEKECFAPAQWVREMSSQPNWLKKMAEKEIILEAKKVQPEKSGSKENRRFRFSAERLKWFGPVCYRTSKAKSVVVDVEIVSPPPNYVLTVVSKNVSHDMIERIHLNTALEFAKKTNDKAVRDWLFHSSPASLRPMEFIPILQACRHYIDSSDPAAAKARELGLTLVKSVNDQDFKNFAARLNDISKDRESSYASSYMYCEYLVALVHLRRLASRTRGDIANDFPQNKLDEVALQAVDVIARNIISGKFHYLTTDGYDRSVGQAALFALQHTYMEYDDNKTIKNAIEVKMKELARDLAQNVDVKYRDTEKEASPPLRPAYYQALIAQVQLGDIKAQDFKDALSKLNDFFNSPIYGASNNGYEDAYRWMYWARVYELLTLLRESNRYPEFLGTDSDPVPNLNKALMSNLASSLTSKLGLGDYYAPAGDQTTKTNAEASYKPSIKIMLAIAVESLRVTGAVAEKR